MNVKIKNRWFAKVIRINVVIENSGKKIEEEEEFSHMIMRREEMIPLELVYFVKSFTFKTKK